MPEHWSIFDLAEGFQLAYAVAALHSEAVLASLTESATADELAEKHQLDAQLLEGVLEYVAARTDILRRRGRRYIANDYTPYGRFLLDQYVGAYGTNAAHLGALLRKPARARALIDRNQHAKAFESLGDAGLGVLPSLVRQLKLNHMLDLGCGPAALLTTVAQQDPSFRGWGVDCSPPMCRAARRRIQTAGVGKRVTVFEGDCTHLVAVLPASVIATVQAVTASSLVNELFADGPANAVVWLRQLRKLLPGRSLLIADYYGRLGKSRYALPRLTGLHDYVQVISGQGVPPPHLNAWRSIYARARCKLIHVVEDRRTTRFVHILRL